MTRPHESATAAGGMPEELQLFLRDTGHVWIDAHEVTSRSWRSAKCAYRVRLTDGRTVKARLLLAGRSAERMQALLADGGASRRCAAVIAARARCVLEEWVEGALLGEAHQHFDVIAECGKALAEIHATPIASVALDRQAAQWELDRVRSDLLVLGARGCLAHAEVELLLSAAARGAPADSPRGVVHLDYCAENIVRHVERGPVCIDNETVGIGRFELDVARTLTRWALDGEPCNVFLAAYVAAGGPADVRDLDFWMLASEAWSARLRVEHGNPEIAPPLAALRRRIEHPPSGA